VFSGGVKPAVADGQVSKSLLSGVHILNPGDGLCEAQSGKPQDGGPPGSPGSGDGGSKPIEWDCSTAGALAPAGELPP